MALVLIFAYRFLKMACGITARMALRRAMDAAALPVTTYMSAEKVKPFEVQMERLTSTT